MRITVRASFFVVLFCLTGSRLQGLDDNNDHSCLNKELFQMEVILNYLIFWSFFSKSNLRNCRKPKENTWIT